jgi:hypothetical protein
VASLSLSQIDPARAWRSVRESRSCWDKSPIVCARDPNLGQARAWLDVVKKDEDVVALELEWIAVVVGGYPTRPGGVREHLAAAQSCQLLGAGLDLRSGGAAFFRLIMRTLAVASRRARKAQSLGGLGVPESPRAPVPASRKSACRCPRRFESRRTSRVTRTSDAGSISGVAAFGLAIRQPPGAAPSAVYRDRTRGGSTRRRS